MNERTTTPGTDYYKIKDNPSHPWSINNLLFDLHVFMKEKHLPEEIFDFIVREMYDEGHLKSSVDRNGYKTTYEIEVAKLVGDNEVVYHLVQAKFSCIQKSATDPIMSFDMRAERDNFVQVVTLIKLLIALINP